MNKKIKDCTLQEFISNKTGANNLLELYPLIAILRYYNRSNYGQQFKDSQWEFLKRQLNNDFLEIEIEVVDNDK